MKIAKPKLYGERNRHTGGKLNRVIGNRVGAVVSG